VVFHNRRANTYSCKDLQPSARILIAYIRANEYYVVLLGIAGRPAPLGKFAGGWRRSKFALANLGYFASRGPKRLPCFPSIWCESSALSLYPGV
jgi:hypothetical protein